MSRSPVPHARTLVRVLALPLVAVGLAAACTEAGRGLGETCLKNQDCQSNLCVDAVCVGSYPLLDAEVDAEAGPPVGDGSSDGGDATTPADASHPPDASDAAKEASPEASLGDAASDSPVGDGPPVDAASDAKAAESGATDSGAD
jgi:hypothetical protein